MITLRPYQRYCVTAWVDALTFRTCTPVIAVPTGGGKSYILCGLIEEYTKLHRDANILILSHTQDIIQQDYDSLLDFFPKAFVGVYSAGLNKKEIKKITVGGIQSVWRRPDKFMHFDLIVVDEVHTVGHKSEGMYRKFFDIVPAKVTGMSATVFRTGHGLIYEDNDLFDYLAYDLTGVENFNRLVEDGYLTKLISKRTDMDMDIRGVKKSGGDYQVKDLSKKFNKEATTATALAETLRYGKNYKKWLVFAIDIAHADSICDQLNEAGIKSDVLHSRMEKDRVLVTKAFKTGDTRAIVSVGMVTTGFDAPCVDLIVLLRPTMSAVLHVQMVGRGLRVAERKDHCLVLDFAGNTKRLGPINDVLVPKKGGKGGGEAPVKECPECGVINHISARVCTVCGELFPTETKLEKKAAQVDIVKKEVEEKVRDIRWLDVKGVQYTIHSKAGKPESLLVVYHCPINIIKEWICLNHAGYAKRKADHWATYRGYRGPLTTYAVYVATDTLAKPKQIQVDFTHKYTNILDAKF